MFRPNRVGAWPIFRLTSWTNTVHVTVGHTEDAISVVFPVADVYENYNSVLLDNDADFSLAAQSGLTLGTAVQAPPGNRVEHIVYSVNASVSTLVVGANNRAAVNLRPYLGLCQGPPSTNNPRNLTRPILLPFQSHTIAGDRHAVSTTDREFASLSATGQLILDVTDIDTTVLNLLVLAVSIYSGEGDAVVTLKNISASLSLHRYIADIDTIDPTR